MSEWILNRQKEQQNGMKEKKIINVNIWLPFFFLNKIYKVVFKVMNRTIANCSDQTKLNYADQIQAKSRQMVLW